MKKLFNILIIFLFLGLMVSCSIFKQNKSYHENEVLGASMVRELYIENGTTFQVDSLINADTLPSLNTWYTSVFVDYETNERILKRMCVKTFNKRYEITYIIVGIKEPFQIEKRIKK